MEGRGSIEACVSIKEVADALPMIKKIYEIYMRWTRIIDKN